MNSIFIINCYSQNLFLWFDWPTFNILHSKTIHGFAYFVIPFNRPAITESWYALLIYVASQMIYNFAACGVVAKHLWHQFLFLLLLGQVFVAVKKWESCIYFQQKLHLCAGSCIYAHIWLLKTWHNLFSFAWTWPKAKIFRSSTSNWDRALSYLAGVVKLLAYKPMRRS